ncbi:biosynthetic-type acetolactate synthase large subunit [Feifania hominis]|uniref:Acetolactate synthase n=1 Tax=Feifania hominis TaxID=2763660 RepID=A0A926HU21_9FIRM|nr:biosynthetic-type acetolactate synthase large subunit [Feifania hominis]MBC8535863.1 biosynthetic-type acetolactate synthase large subunit [Feifania hominis]
MKLNGSEILIECLKEQGVDTIFGFPGGAVLNIYDALYKHRDEITHILTSHEQGAAHAADGYARATGKVGVCIATSGPGATNLVTGIATAMMDSVPMVAITANVTLPLLGRDSFQEVDIAGITMPITKHNYIVKDVGELARTVREAFRIAREGRPGPVLIDITKDVTAAVCDYEKKLPKIRPTATVSAEMLRLDEAIQMIHESRQPYVFVGGGAILADCSEELLEFVETIDAPVCDSLMGKGAFPGDHPHYTGMLGMHGTKTSNLGVTNCDLLIVLGSRFSDRVIGNAEKFAANAKILQIDIDPAEINKNIGADYAIVGNLKDILAELNRKLPRLSHQKWMAEIAMNKQSYSLAYDESTLTGPYVIEELSKLDDGSFVIATDVGQHQMWTAQYYKFRSPRTLLTSGGLGTMGYGLGAAIGAQVGCPDKHVFNIAGDGCFRMNLNELATAVRHQIPVVEIILNNHVLGMVRQWQTLFYEGHYSSTTLSDGVDFVKIARGFGCEALAVTKREEVGPALRRAIASKRPFVLDCQIGMDDSVWPMVAPGAAISDIIIGK